jgi:hypothetical protein
MNIRRRMVVFVAAIAVLAAGGGGIAYAVGGDGEESVTGPDAERAKSAALAAAGGGTVREVERQDGDGAGVVRIVHRGWEGLGRRGPDLRTRNRQGWARVLPHYTRACAEHTL